MSILSFNQRHQHTITNGLFKSKLSLTGSLLRTTELTLIYHQGIIITGTRTLHHHAVSAAVPLH